MKEKMAERHYDVIIIGAGLAGLSLARQILLNSSKRILLIDKKKQIPPARQKVGEATVQLSGYYFSRVLDLEEHLLREHFMKYNLRFFWKRSGEDGAAFEDYQSAFITKLSNIASYQLDRNKLEAELLRLNQTYANFSFHGGITDLAVDLQEGKPHQVAFKKNRATIDCRASWVVDTTGRSQFLSRKLDMDQPNTIRHGASFFWVDGLLNIEKLTDLSHGEMLKRPDRRQTGHLPFWLATNHFMGEGFWFWVIPLQGKTSLGLVYDNTVISPKDVSTPQKLTEWICQRFPMFSRDLPHRKIVSRGGFADFSYSCEHTISPNRWALSGESARFSDPLYSPGGDLIALHNTMIVDAILTDTPNAFTQKVALYDQMMKWLYEAYVPSYSLSYDVLGDQEVFTLKYTWELTIYFAFYVFPFINDLFTERGFLVTFLNRFTRLGPINRGIQIFLKDFYHWKKANLAENDRPLHHDFFKLGPLAASEKTFYEVGVSADQARQVLDEQLRNLEELARFTAAWACSRVLDDPIALLNREFVAGINLKKLHFDAAEIVDFYASCADCKETYPWSFDTNALADFISRETPSPMDKQLAIAGVSHD